MEKPKMKNWKPSSEAKNGGPNQIDSALPQALSSFNNLSEQWLTEQWLVKSGVLPDSAIDTLLLYAYVQKGVLHNGVTLEINKDESNEGANPSITYKIKLEPAAYLKWKALRGIERRIKNTLFQKAMLLALAKGGAPFGMEDQIISLAKEYLPKNYKVEVQVIE
jgi:hypothetical protein